MNAQEHAMQIHANSEAMLRNEITWAVFNANARKLWGAVPPALRAHVAQILCPLR